MAFKSNADEIIQKLEKMKRNAEELSGKHDIPFSDLFPSEFMHSHTKFESIEELIRSSGFAVQSSGDIEKLPDDEWNNYIQKCTCFSNWREMVQTAGKEYFAKKIGLR